MQNITINLKNVFGISFGDSICCYFSHVPRDKPPPKTIRSKGAFVFLELSSQRIHREKHTHYEIIGVDEYAMPD